jgi:hypothetical protein
VYFLLNTGLVATAIALSTRTPIITTWQDNFLWSAPSYFVGALMAAMMAWIYTLPNQWVAVIPLLAAPVIATYHSYKVYL